MATNVNLSDYFFDVGGFAYDEDRPTFYTEMLSCRLLGFLAGLGSAGAKVSIESSTITEQQGAAESFISDFGSWLSEVSDAVTAYLLADEGSRPVLLLPAAPALPALIGGAVVLYKGILIKMGVDTAASVIRTISQIQADRRATQMPRMLDKALFDSSYWGLSKEPKLDRLIQSLDSLNASFNHYDDVEGLESLTQVLSRIGSEIVRDSEGNFLSQESIVSRLKQIAEKDGTIKLLLQAILTHGGQIDEIEFTTNDEG